MKIINFLKKMKSEGVEFNELITLPLMIDQLDDYAHESDNHKRAWSLMILYRDALDQPLILSQFIPCDSEGKPLEKVNRDDMPNNVYIDNEKDMKLYDTYHEYQEALKAVIFEGFELYKGDNPEYKYLSSSDYLISGFHSDSDMPDLNIASIVDARNVHVSGEGLQTISDLAEATQDNPIKLR